ncbi:MAG: hypothetical protein EOP00_28155 [Pedobacter sp.]|nr:MAG: hypothetical protein EOP00_28155 [Pedobacter sp.]
MDFPVKDWEFIPIAVYKALLAETKERFTTIPDETVSVTEKSIKCLLGYLTFFLAVGVFLFSNHYTISWWIFLSLILASTLVILRGYKIIKLRPSHITGLLPENVLSSDFEGEIDFTHEEKEKLYYLNAIKTYNQKIIEGTEDNNERAEKYDSFLKWTLALVFATVAFLLFTIYSHPVSVKP